MPMLRRLQRAQAWNSSGYVCHSCRQKLVAAQSRWQSQVSSAAGRGNDDWLSNFNDLGGDLSPRSTGTPPVRRLVSDGSLNKTNGNGERDAGAVERSAGERRHATAGESKAMTMNISAMLKPSGSNTADFSPKTSVGERHHLLKEDVEEKEKGGSRGSGNMDTLVEKAFAQKSVAEKRRLVQLLQDALATLEERNENEVRDSASRMAHEILKSLPIPDIRNKRRADLPRWLRNPANRSISKRGSILRKRALLTVARLEKKQEQKDSVTPLHNLPEENSGPKLFDTLVYELKKGFQKDVPTHGEAARAGSQNNLDQPPLRGAIEERSVQSIELYAEGAGLEEEEYTAGEISPVAPKPIKMPESGSGSTVTGQNSGAHVIRSNVEHSEDREKWVGPSGREVTGTLGTKIRRFLSDGFNAPFLRPLDSELQSHKKQLARVPQSGNEVDETKTGQEVTLESSQRLASLHQINLTSTESPQSTQSDGDVAHEPAKKDETSRPKKSPKTAGRKSRRTLRRGKVDHGDSNGAAVATAAGTTTDIHHTNGSPGDDGEHKSLREVMSLAEAMTEKQSGNAIPSDSKVNDKAEKLEEPSPLDLSGAGSVNIVSIQPSSLKVKALDIPQPPVPRLEYGLDRVLFNPGVYQLQDPHSRVFNFDPYLQKIMPVIEFDFNALKEYKTSSQDTILSTIAKEQDKRYIGSTSSMTGTLAHFHYLLSDFRPLNLNMLSRGFAMKRDDFTRINRAPNAIFLRWKNGTYAIDADKEYDGANVLMMLGKSMEKLLTLPKSEYERYRKSDPRNVPEEERTAPEAFQYTTMGDFLMRSQLDAYDPRLPGTGMFDLKTRSVLSVRMDAEDFEPMVGYEIHTLQGNFQSYEREYYDMMRATMLKYLLQARMGRMNGIFAAYHNVERIFGFQYISVEDMDRAIHGQIDPCLGDQEFRTSLELMNKVFDKATAKFPEQSLRFHFETTVENLNTGSTTVMWIFAEPMKDTEIDRIQTTSKAKVAEFERTMMGFDRDDKDASEPIENPADVEAKDGEPVTSHSASSTSDTPPSSSSWAFGTSDSGADPAFLESISSSSQERKPLFVASLICQTRVNGTSERCPAPLKPSDQWEVDYLLQEMEANDSTWARYEQTKARRKELFMEFRDEDEDVNGLAEGSKKKDRGDHFIKFLRELAKNGREFRSKMDQLEADKIPVVLGQQLAPEGTHAAERVKDVETYMDWLYESRGTSASPKD